jgi:hypothetical protein
VKKLVVAGGLVAGLVMALPTAAFAANDYSAWASCQHGISVELSGWPKAYTVTINDNGAPVINSANKAGAKFSHTETDKTSFAIADKTIPHSIVIDVRTSEQGQSFADTIDMPACGSTWPGYVFTTEEP